MLSNAWPIFLKSNPIALNPCQRWPCKKKVMQENSKDYEFCIKVALENAKKRINLLDDSDKNCVLEEYKEWIKDGLSSHTVLLLRDDPII